MEYQSRHTKKRKHEALTEETVEDKPSPEAKTSGSGTADPDEMFPEQEKPLNGWKKFMNTSWEKWVLLYMKITDLDEWIHPIVKHNLNCLKGHLEDVEATCFDPHTGECDSIIRITSFKELFKTRIREIEKLVNRAEFARDKTSLRNPPKMIRF